MMQYLVIAVSLLRHHGRSYLAETHTVTPAGTRQCELLRYPFLVLLPASTTKAEL